jgi:ubiquinone/menaquinone biosynthesis C-methylase UbiE
MKFYDKDSKSAYNSQYEAQRIAFGPVIFQASKVMRDIGILECIEASNQVGITLEEIAKKLDLPIYGTRVLLEAGLGIGLVYLKEKNYVLTNVGYYILNDKMTRVNMDFTHDVNYLGTFYLEEAIKTGTPAGLKVLGDWPTIYQGLTVLPPHIQKSWYDFDHYYSDMAFPEVLPIFFKNNPKKIMDIGGNTGKWSLMCAQYAKDNNLDSKITIVDLQLQLNKAAVNIKERGFENVVSGYPTDMLDPSLPLPKGSDAVWMSQFLDCFSEDQIVAILQKIYNSIDDNGFVYILETYWDRQKFSTSAFCLQQISLYFTCLANGNSQIYHSENMINCIKKANFTIVEDLDNIGLSHTLFKCKKN